MKEDEELSKDQRKSAALAVKAIRSGIDAIKSPSQASATLDELQQAHEGRREEDIPQKTASARRQAEKIARAPDSTKPDTVLAETARQVAEAPEENQPVLDRAISVAAKDPGSGRSLLRQALLKKLGPLDGADAYLFVQVNQLPHPRWLNKSLSRFSWFMTGGHAWTVVPVSIALATQTSGPLRKGLWVMPSLWCATFCIEVPIKHWCRRKRPFISIVEAIVVGRKPGSYSFPSGHSAAAFAGAALLSKSFPRGRGLFYTVAGLVAFSRIFLGAHYPGDVLSGGILGTLLAKAFARFFRPKVEKLLN